MTPTRRIRTIRRPSIVAVVLGTAALAAVPPSAGLLGTPAVPAPRAADADAGGLAGLLESVTPLTPTERARRDPAAEPVRFNPVAFRLPDAPAGAAAAPVPAGGPQNLPPITTTAKPGTAAAAAIEFALAQRGLPYIWGGNGPQQGDAGFDCSGLTTAAYAYAGIDLPRTAHTQYYAGPHVPAGAELEPGDLVFYGVPERVHHVGLYLGDGRMINAPSFGKPVRLAYVRYDGDDYLGATRPAAGRDAGPLDEALLATPDLPVVVPPVPAPEVPLAPEEFTAPEVPAEDMPAEVTTGEPDGDAQMLAQGEPAGLATPDSTQETTAPESTTSEAAPTRTPQTTTPDVAGSRPPVALTLPDGTGLDLSKDVVDVNDLPSAPAEPGIGGMWFSRAKDDDPAQTTVSLHPDTDTGALQPGAVIVVHAEDGSFMELTVRSRDTVDVETASDLTWDDHEVLRAVLLLVDPDSDEVLIVIAA